MQNRKIRLVMAAATVTLLTGPASTSADEFTKQDLARWEQQFQGVVKEGRALWTSAELGTTEWVLPRPDAVGEYFFRYRSIEPDGFVSAYSATLKTEITRDLRPLWLLLLPLLIGI